MSEYILRIGEGSNTPLVVVDLDDTQLKPMLPILIDVTGETDEQYYSRQNSYINRLFGIEKPRKESTWVAGKMPDLPPLQMILKNCKMETFRHYWNWGDCIPTKMDICTLHNTDKCYTLHGVFPAVINSEGYFELIVDKWECREVHSK